MSNERENYSKPFLSLEEQIKKLESRNLIIDFDINKEQLLFGNYYSIINGYKTPFLEKQDGEKYIQDSSFNDIYNLSHFDRDLRDIFLKYILIFEEEIKAILAYRFAEKFEGPEAYLFPESYNSQKGKNRIIKNIEIIQKEIKHQYNNTKNRNYIKHYRKKHKIVPIWVLVNTLTFGNISHIYDLLKEDLRDKIAKDFSIRYKREYKNNSNAVITKNLPPKSLQDILKISNYFRNVCAHSEVLYLYSLNKEISDFSHFFKEIHSQVFQRSHLFALTCVLKLVLPQEYYTELIERLNTLFDEYGDRIKSIDFQKEVLSRMDFPINWYDLLS